MAKLKKNLGLMDVYAISTGAMFSSGFFLLPGLAAAQTGSSVVLAYFLAGLMIIPAMLSQAELATAMPRAGGSYFFVDRAMGPLFGMIGGLGTWVALVLKSAFALIGMGAYLVIFFDLPIIPVAVVLTLAFGVLNLVGAKESSRLQRVLVAVLVVILGFFVIQGFAATLDSPRGWASWGDDYTFARNGLEGIIATVGMVFVSYAGLTKVASVAEEVEKPDRNIPLGMFLSLATATFIYCAGVYVMTVVLDPSEFYKDLTPVATAADAFMTWLPGSTGVVLMVIAAIAAFASTGNAGVMSASRYPFAMARDRLLPDRFGEISAKGIPVLAVLATTAAMIVCLIAFDVSAVAKLASAFQLVLFALISAAVIVMRESRLEFYQPGFRSPLYPWMQIAGIVIPIWLIWEMGWLAVGFSLGVVAVGVVAFHFYARKRVHRRGAIRHVFERMGRSRHEELHHELRRVVSDKGLRDDDEFDELFDNALELRLQGPITLDEMMARASDILADELDLDPNDLVHCFMEESRLGMMPIEDNGAVPHHLYHGLEEPQVMVVHVDGGVPLHLDEATAHVVHDAPISNFIFLLSPDEDAARHYRYVAEIASRLDRIPEPQSQPDAEHSLLLALSVNPPNRAVS
ncbi:amino acid permease [Persicimonas caeni]|uniref:Amino acid permease n=1 Tax=Persicimonas caeni TaxID=2292766 RepID=A0A4Y6PXI3_PERCE|nr:APC family permease [Persicimonas caeni]QDG53042.1 amino acid permease [Persicimonas caeni]QED34264.1 amino acid permease [Persicimonas caeni]